MKRILDWINNLYPVWLVTLGVIAYLWPQTMLWFSGPWVFWALALSMLGMGLTLSLDDFRRVGSMPGCVVLGFCAQYTIMPLAGWSVATVLQLDPGTALGIILVASCPGGMASNMISLLARANVALSVVLTLISTLLSFLFTPLWCSLLARKEIEVDTVGMSLSAMKMVVAPVVIGVLIRWKMPRTADRIGTFGPTIAVVAFTLVSGGIAAASAEAIKGQFGKLALAATLLHIIGFATGYILAKVLRYPESIARTVSIEVGMQNGGMASALARKHFPTLPLAAAAAVFSGVIQNIIGGLMAAWWKSRPMNEEEVPESSGNV